MSQTQLFSGRSNGAVLLREICYNGLVNTATNPVSLATQHNFGIDSSKDAKLHT